LDHLVVVEDEVIIGVFIREALRDKGFSVAVASDAEESLPLFQTETAAAIIDVGLPQISGDRLAQQLRQLRPQLPIVLTTGYDHQIYETMFAGDELVRILGKPFDEFELLASLESLNVRPQE
jgi:DNA-binding response OmpR family regulator